MKHYAIKSFSIVNHAVEKNQVFKLQLQEVVEVKRPLSMLYRLDHVREQGVGKHAECD